MYTSSLVFFVLVGVFSLPSVSLPDGDKDIPGCRSIDYRCGGNRYVVDYPFRLPSYPSYCGHPGFDLRCIDNSMLHMTIGGKDYVVNSMDYENQTLHLTDQSFAGEDQSCNAFTDASFDTGLFGYTSADANLTVYFNCSPRPGLPLLGRGRLSCFDGDKGSFYTLAPGVGKNCCTSAVKVPIISDYGNDGAPNDLAGALRRGFELKWKAGDGWCKKCTDSNGICWNDVRSANGWGCFCSGSSSADGSCVPTKGNTGIKDMKIRIGFRGSIGYIAPEVFSRSFGVVSSKSDVYSYGMVVLEMVGGRKKCNHGC